MRWPLVIVSSFAVIFVLWLGVLVRASARQRPLQKPQETAKNDVDTGAILIMLPALIAISSG
jgi:cytoskeletal protein RodZ